MSYRVKLIQINRRTGHVHERLLQRHYATQQDAHRTAQQLCVTSNHLFSQAVAIAQGVSV